MPNYSKIAIREVLPEFAGDLGGAKPERLPLGQDPFYRGVSGAGNWMYKAIMSTPTGVSRMGITHPAPEINPYYNPEAGVVPGPVSPISEIASNLLSADTEVSSSIPGSRTPMPFPRTIPPLNLGESKLGFTPTRGTYGEGQYGEQVFGDVTGLTPSTAESRGGGFLDSIKQQFSMDKLSNPGMVSFLGALGSAIAGGEGTIGGELGKHAQLMARTQAYTELLNSLTTGGEMPDTLTMSALSAEDVTTATKIAQETSKAKLAEAKTKAEIKKLGVETETYQKELETPTKGEKPPKPSDVKTMNENMADQRLNSLITDFYAGEKTEDDARKEAATLMPYTPQAKDFIDLLGIDQLSPAQWTSAYNTTNTMIQKNIDALEESKPFISKKSSEMEKAHAATIDMKVNAGKITQRIFQGNYATSTEGIIWDSLVAGDNPVAVYAMLNRYSEYMTNELAKYAQTSQGQYPDADTLDRLSAMALLYANDVPLQEE